MQPDSTINIIWWISAVEIPVMAGLFWLFWRSRQDCEHDLDEIRHEMEKGFARAAEALAAYKLEVAKSYASISTMREVEKRLTQHLLRIEQKLDGSGARA
ncbi:MAG: hypothetical protein H7840_02690 [Alphaproteobacteria bacterium]